MKLLKNGLQIKSHVAIVLCLSLFLTACFGNDNKQPDPDLDEEAQELSECSQKHWDTLKKLKESKEAIEELEDKVRDIRKLPKTNILGDDVAGAAATEIGKFEFDHLIETEVELAIALCKIGCNPDDADDVFWNEIAAVAGIDTSCDATLASTCNEEELGGVWACSYTIPYPEGCIIDARETGAGGEDPEGHCEFYEYAWSEGYTEFADCPGGLEWVSNHGSKPSSSSNAHKCRGFYNLQMAARSS